MIRRARPADADRVLALLDACLGAARERGCEGLLQESCYERADADRVYDAYCFVHGGRAYSLPLA